MKDVFIKSVLIKNFRAIVTELLLEFYDKNDEASSVLLVGDNGSGKSSVIDALEFGTQGRIKHVNNFGMSIVPEVKSAFSKGHPTIEIKLSNGNKIKRIIHVDSDGKKMTDRSINCYFNQAPFILRRSDILLFWNTPEIQRQVIFFSYFSGSNIESFDEPLQMKRLEFQEQKYQLKRKRRKIRTQIAKKFNIDEKKIPYDIKKFDEFEKLYVYHGLKIKKRMKKINKGYGLQIDFERKKMFDEYKKISFDLIRTDSEYKKYSPNVVRKISKDDVKSVLEDISFRVTDHFLKLSGTGEYVKRIKLRLSNISETSLSFTIKLINGYSTSPEKIFSEANLDLLAIIIFIELIREAGYRGQAKVLVLDDVFQSIDSTIRLKVLDYILKEMDDWQLIISVHDRLWKEQLLNLFKINNKKLLVYEILEWDHIVGPRIVGENLSTENSLERCLNNGGINEIFSNASIMLEKICNNLSYRLPISVTRRRGDKYTIGDLWPGICKKLKKTNISDVIINVDQQVYLRNLLGGHFNEWAQAISRKEALDFGEAIKELLHAAYCFDCNFWVEEVRIGPYQMKKWSCRCGKCFIEKK